MSEIAPELTQKFSSACSSVRDILIPCERLTEQEIRAIIRRYVAAFEGNFIAWVAAAVVSARSTAARLAAYENLQVELKEDHPTLLRHFATHLNAEPYTADFRKVADAVQRIRKLIAEMSGLKTTALLAVIENVSQVEIPYLEQLARKLGSSDLTYTEVHTQADINHANQFIEALFHEIQTHYHHPDSDIDEAVQAAVNLHEAILNPKRASAREFS